MFRATFPVITPASILLLCSSFICAQSTPPTHPPRPKLVGPAKWTPSPQEVSATYWTLEPGWDTELELRNNLTSHELIVTPVLRTAGGLETLLATVTIPPQHIVSLDLRNAAEVSPDVLNQLGADHSGAFGSAIFRFEGLSFGNLFAATIVQRVGRPIDFHFDAEDKNFTSGGIEGVWWNAAARSNDYLILSNPHQKPVTGSLLLSAPSGASRSLPIIIAGRSTLRVDLREAVGPMGSEIMGGLSLSLPGKESLGATQIVFDESVGLAAVMKLFQREPEETSGKHVLRAPMIALSQPDPGLGFPAGTTLIPRIFLRNAGQSAEQLSATINWRSESDSGNLALPGLILKSGDIKVLNLADYQSAGQIPPDATWATVSLAYQGDRRT